MNRRGVLGGIAFLAAVPAVAVAAGDPILTRGSAALPPGCGPLEAARGVAQHAGELHSVVYAMTLPDRALARSVRLEAGLVGPDGPYTAAGVMRCRTLELTSWTTSARGPFEAPGTCPRPRGWTAALTVACSARPAAWETASTFRVRGLRAPAPRCSAPLARARTVAVLRALNYGNAARLAASFSRSASFHPYSASLLRPLRGRAAISRFAARRIARADGWTATTLRGPTTKSRGAAAFALALVAYANGRPVGAGSASVTLDCRSGLITRWLGPALPLPG